MVRVEFKKLTRTLTFVLFYVVMVATYITQMGPDLNTGISKPMPGAEYYGTMRSENADVIMPSATNCLLEEYYNGYYQAYPFMLYKEVYLKQEDEQKLVQILQSLTGLSENELESFSDFEPAGYVEVTDEEGKNVVCYQEAILPDYEFNRELSYEEFKQLMNQVDDIIGGGSRYASKNLATTFSEVPMTYEDAIKEYEEIVSVDNIALSYTRMFCDYMGIFIPVMVAFVAAFYWSLDRHAKMQDVIYCREISTVKLISIRISTLVISLLPAIIFPYIHMIFKMVTMYSDMSIKWGKAVGLMLLWLVPEILFVSLFVALITELISPLVAIFIQGAWWFMALQMNSLVGGISKWTLILRHNSFGSLSIWNDEWNNVIWDRTFYMLFSILIIIAFMIIYDVKRKGKLNFEVKHIKRDSSKKS